MAAIPSRSRPFLCFNIPIKGLGYVVMEVDSMEKAQKVLKDEKNHGRFDAVITDKEINDKAIEDGAQLLKWIMR